MGRPGRLVALVLTAAQRQACYRLTRSITTGTGAAHRVAHRRVLLRVRKQIVELLLGAVRLDAHADADPLVAGRHAVVEPEQPLQVEVA